MFSLKHWPQSLFYYQLVLLLNKQIISKIMALESYESIYSKMNLIMKKIFEISLFLVVKFLY